MKSNLFSVNVNILFRSFVFQLQNKNIIKQFKYKYPKNTLTNKEVSRIRFPAKETRAASHNLKNISTKKEN